MTKLNLNSSAQAERPIGASAVKILASGGKDPKGATSTDREAMKADEERERHRDTWVEVYTRTTKKVNIHEASDKKAPGDPVTKLKANSSAQEEGPLGQVLVKFWHQVGKSPRGPPTFSGQTD